MVHWGKCKYVTMVKMKSGYRVGESKRLGRVLEQRQKDFVCHVCRGEFGLHLEGHRQTIEAF